jgi:hypothetical protein
VMGREEFAATGSGGRSSGRAVDHCKTSDDMLAPRCPHMVIQRVLHMVILRAAELMAPPSSCQEGQRTTRPNTSPRRSACALRVSVVDTGLNGEHGTGSIEQDALGVGPQDQLADRSAPAQADHDEVRVDLVGHLDQVL